MEVPEEVLQQTTGLLEVRAAPPELLPSMVQQLILRNKDRDFQAGGIKHQQAIWNKFTSCSENLETIGGLNIEIGEISNSMLSHQYPLNEEETEFVSLEINFFLSQNVIVQCNHDELEVVSPIFTRQKTDGLIALF